MTKNKASYFTEVSSSAYQGKVAREAVQRAGHCKNLKGHVFEIMCKDRYNSDPRNIMSGKKMYLVKSKTATRDDLIAKQNGKIIARMQCKDTPSDSGIRDTVNRIKSGQYSRTNIVGTTETASMANKALDHSDADTKIRIKDSGISTKHTELVALQANGGNPLQHLDVIGHHAKNTGEIGAVVGAGVSAVKNGVRVAKGIRDIDEVVVSVAADATKAGVAASIAGVVDVSLTMAVATVPPLMPIAKPIGFVGGMAAGYLVNKGAILYEKHIGKCCDQVVQRKFLTANDGYAYLKRQGII